MEQVLIDISFFIVYAIPNAILIYIFYVFTLEPKFRTRYALPLFGVAQQVIYNLIYNNVPYALRFIIQLFVIFVPAIFLFKDNIKKKLWTASFLFGFVMVMDMLISFFVFEIFGFAAVQMEVKTWACVLQALIINSLMALATTFVIIIWRKKINHFPIKSTSLFIFFPISQAVNVAGYFFQGKDVVIVRNPFTNPFTLISLLLYIISDIFMFFTLRENSKLEQTRRQLSEMENEMAMKMRYYESINRRYIEMREYRHDIKNLVAAAEISIRSGAAAEGIALIDELRERSDSLKIPVYCNNPIVNAVLWEKQKDCAEYGIDFAVNIPPEEDAALEQSDACSLFANLLDNAIRAARNTASPFVSVSCRSEIGMFFLEVRNSSGQVFSADSLPQGKDDGDHHGCGMQIVRRIADKYNGSFSISSDGKIASAYFSACVA